MQDSVVSYMETHPVGLEIFVSPEGDDGASGTINDPLRTLEAARDRAAQYLSSNPVLNESVVIQLRQGTYRRDTPLVFLPQHSGRADAPIIYNAYNGEKVVISGGKALSGNWEAVAGKPYFALEIPEAKDGNWTFNHLFVNGENRTRARTPNYDEKVFRSNGRVPRWSQSRSLRFWGEDIDPTWSDIENIDLIMPMTWTPVHHRISKIDFTERGVELASADGQHQLYGDTYVRYYLSNVFEGLDVPGEWYLNTTTGILYYIPMPGEILGEVSVVAPVLISRLVTLQGDAINENTVSFLEFHGLEFRHTDTDRERWDGVYRQAHAYLDAAVYAEGATDTIFKGCTFANLGEYAMEFEIGSQRNAVSQCLFHDIGGGGIQIGISDLSAMRLSRATAGVSPTETEFHPRTDVLDTTVENSIIFQIGTYWTGSYAIGIRFASFTSILHNEIFDTHYTAIAVDARWDNYRGENYCRGNAIAYNHLYHAGRGFHSDGGALYQFGPSENHYHHNLIHDLTKWPIRNSMKGIFFDQQSRSIVAENNLIYDIEGVGLAQNWGTDTLFQNNIVAFTEGGASKGRVDPSGPSASNNVSLLRNVFISDGGIGLDEGFPVSTVPDTIENNLFYDTTFATVRIWGMSIAQWQNSTGLGAGTIFADPGFADLSARDFSLSSANAALQQIGFEPFTQEIETAGIYGADDWVSKPDELLQRLRPIVPHWTQQEIDALEARVDPDVIPEGTIHPEADAYVRSGAQASFNFGTSDTLIIGTEATDPTLGRRAYLRFDLSAISADSVTATLRLKLSSARSDFGAAAYFVADDSWDETTITWDNRSPESLEIDRDTVPLNGMWMEFDVSAYVQSEAEGDGKLSVVIIGDSGFSSRFYSGDVDTNYWRPQLVVEDGDPAVILGTATLVRNNPFQASWENADVWSNGEAANPAYDYLVDGSGGNPNFLRSPHNVASATFPGNSLTLRGRGGLWLKSAPGGELTVDDFILDDGRIVSSYDASTVILKGNLTIADGGVTFEGNPGPLIVQAFISGFGPIISDDADRDTTIVTGDWAGDIILSAGTLRFQYDITAGGSFQHTGGTFDLSGRNHTFLSLSVDGVLLEDGVYTADSLGDGFIGAGSLTIDSSFEGWIDTGSWMGMLYLLSDTQWVFSGDLGRWLYIPGDVLTGSAPWIYIPKLN